MRLLLALVLTLSLCAPLSAQEGEAQPHTHEHFYPADTADPLDVLLFKIVGGDAASVKPFYAAFMDAQVIVVGEKGLDSGKAPQLLARVKDGQRTVDAYTSKLQYERAPKSAQGKTIQMTGRELLKLLVPYEAEAGINSYSGHGGRLTVKKIAELLK